MKNTAAIYARVSSERQKEEGTIASQTALLLEHAKAHELSVPNEWIFEDEGYSGATMARPGLERLRDLAAEGQIEVVLIYAPDRLSRKYAYQVLLTEEFCRHGVETIFLKSAAAETPEERLMLQFQGMIAEYERAQIAERTRRGKRHRAKTGCVNLLCGAPYGYRYIRKSEHSQAYYEVVEAPAEVVRKIFAWYTQELLSIGAIARRLNEERIPTRSDRGLWERSTVWGMLRNPAYQGRACFGKTEICARQRITRPLRQKGGYSRRSSSSREKGRSQWIEIAVPALVSPATFAAAQERLAQNKQRSLRNTREPTLLQGLLVCEQCGYALYRTSMRTTRRQIKYYRCLGSDRYRHLRGPACSCRPIRQDYLDDLVWQEVLTRPTSHPQAWKCQNSEMEEWTAEYFATRRPHYSPPTAPGWSSSSLSWRRSCSFGSVAFGGDPVASCNAPTVSQAPRCECGPVPFSRAAPWPGQVRISSHLFSCSVLYATLITRLQAFSGSKLGL